VTDFDAEKFEDKYVHYFDELEQAYTNAYQHFHGQKDSELLRAIDRKVLAESEPFYEGDGEFRIELPDDPRERADPLSVDDETFQETLSAMTDQIERELQDVFGFEATR
jgi:hypothetical protein